MAAKDTTLDNANTRMAYSLLKTGFILAPIIAGLDKYFNLLADWTTYLAPVFPQMLGIEPETFMNIVGAVEIIAGLGVALKPRVFANIVGLWLLSIIVNLLVLGNHYDIALRDFGLMLGSVALGRMAVHFEAPERAGARRKRVRTSGVRTPRSVSH